MRSITMMKFMGSVLRGAVLSLVFVSGLNLKPIDAKAQTFNGVTSEGVGGAGRAAVDPLDVGRLNPAGLSHLQGYRIGTEYREREFSEKSSGHLWAISVADGSRDVAFPGAFTYQKRFQFVPGDRLEQDHYFLSVAERVGERWSVGLTAHHLRSRMRTRDAVSMIQADLGLLWTPNPHLGLGLVGYNLAGKKEDVASEANLFRTLGFGSHVLVAGLLRIRADYVHRLQDNPDSRGHLMAGFESLSFKWMVLRAGWFDDSLGNLRGLTLGWGLDGPRLKLNVSAQYPQGGDERYGVDMQILL